MRYTKSKFIEDVKREARALRKHATKKEISRLEAKTLDPTNKRECIYGQMTGYCTSKRASELIFNSCKRFSHSVGTTRDMLFSQVKINGAKIDGVSTVSQLRSARGYSVDFFSSIEIYILLKSAKNKNLIAYIKGETNQLIL